MANPLAASTPQLSTPGGMGLPHAPGCCEVGQPVFADPRTGHPVCACQLGGGLMPGAPRVPGPADLPYSMPPTLQGPAGSFPGGEPAFYASMGSAYGLKESPEVFQGIPSLGGYYPYDPTMIYPYMNGFGGLDARRKNATKESTNTLKAWLYEHRKNPYPTKGEKIMLAILTKMTLTQVSTWFANARRRLKKENKVGWSSKGDEDEDDKDEDRTGSDDEDIGRAHNDRSLDDDGAISDISEPTEEPHHANEHKEEDVDVDGDDEDDDFHHKMSPIPPLHVAHRHHTISGGSISSNPALVPITPPPSPGGHHLSSASTDRYRVVSAVPSPRRVDIPASVQCTRTVAPSVNREAKQNSAPKPKIWSVDDMMSKKEPSSSSSSSSSPSAPASIRPSPTSATHAPYLPPQFYPGFNGLSSAENGMSLALAYSRSLAAAGSAGLQVYSMAPAYHPGMEAASHQMSMGHHHPGVRPTDSYKPQPSHTVAMGGGASTEGKGHSRMSPTVEHRRVSEPIRNGLAGTTAFRPVLQRR